MRETPYTLAKETGHLKCDSQDRGECQAPPECSQHPGSSGEGSVFSKGWTGPCTAHMMPSHSHGPVNVYLPGPGITYLLSVKVKLSLIIANPHVSPFVSGP